jgi:D-glycerate 3-kinase
MPNDASTRSAYPDAVVDRVLDRLLADLEAAGGPGRLIGASGLQGSGKTTLAHQLGDAAAARGIPCDVLSLDDFYYGRRERQRLARDVHPLLATRGVPGTHDVALVERTLDALPRASARDPVRVPRFDKGRDTRVPPSRWRRITRPPRLVLFEGWCVGVPPQPERALAAPANALERECDPDGTWRRYVNDQLAGPYARLWRRLGRLMLLQAPGFDVVVRWRGRQEQARRRRHAPHALDPAALRRFLQFFERLSRYALKTLPARSDLVLRLDERHDVIGMRG